MRVPLLLIVFLLMTISSNTVADPALSSDNGNIIRPVTRTYVGDNHLPILQLLGMGSEFHGRTISHLLLRAKSENGKGLASVSINGVDATLFQAIGSSTQTYVFTLPSPANQIGDPQHPLEFHLRGRIYIVSVGIKLDPARAP